MTIGFSIDYIWYEVGTSDFLHAFFSTISFHLEPNGWGSKYPYLMNYLYQGNLPWENAKDALLEVEDIREQLKKFGPGEVVWDIEDLKKQPPWGNEISEKITNLEVYFVTSDGRKLFDVLVLALKDSIDLKLNLEISSM